MKPEVVLLWHEIRKVKSFTCLELAAAVGCDPSVAQKYVKLWLGKGYLEPIAWAISGADDSTFYRLLVKNITFPPVEFAEKGRDRVWRTIRIMRKFTIVDLCGTASVTETVAHKFVAKLLRVKVLRIDKPNNSGSKGSFQSYRLINDLGCGTPIFLNDGRVLDSNSGKFLEVKDEQSRKD